MENLQDDEKEEENQENEAMEEENQEKSLRP